MRIIARKNVGIIYHFVGSSFEGTAEQNLKTILSSGLLKSRRNYTSFTRNFQLPKTNGLTFGGRFIRIAIDGDLLSDRYKLEPFIDAPYNLRERNAEDETIVRDSVVDIGKAILRIDILENGKILPENLIDSRLFKDKKPVIQNIILKTQTEKQHDANVRAENEKYKRVHFVSKWVPVK